MEDVFILFAWKFVSNGILNVLRVISFIYFEISKKTTFKDKENYKYVRHKL